MSSNRVIGLNDYLVGEFGRLREVLVAPDGRVFLFTSNRGRGHWKWQTVPVLGDDKLIMLKPSGERPIDVDAID